ncbi:DUF29 family protein [Pseudoduganella sp. FT25W]|jgi:hypothetical protein|uniref:DUF29 family protein n=1 Tax=Duganella alba TaxID=2666081 RepID=A0A6L5QC02_9BURK|nr:DUF29 domain-containing protein [Duganella alba]MRX07110.1 DUF29 family protein [Duganella alba]MRX15195.1 DUF29 family protein [Duganella alba]
MDDHLNNLYQADFYRWLHHQAALLQARDFERLDLPNLIEEVESMGNNKKHQLEHRLEVLLMHLLKCQMQPQRITRGWIGTIVEQRKRIRKALKKMPSLRASLDASIAEAYEDAVDFAAFETGLPKSSFPAAPPYSTTQILDEDFFP